MEGKNSAEQLAACGQEGQSGLTDLCRVVCCIHEQLFNMAVHTAQLTQTYAEWSGSDLWTAIASHIVLQFRRVQASQTPILLVNGLLQQQQQHEASWHGHRLAGQWPFLATVAAWRVFSRCTHLSRTAAAVTL